MDERVEEARVDLHAPLREMGHDQRQRRNEVIAQLQFSRLTLTCMCYTPPYSRTRYTLTLAAAATAYLEWYGLL